MAIILLGSIVFFSQSLQKRKLKKKAKKKHFTYFFRNLMIDTRYTRETKKQ